MSYISGMIKENKTANFSLRELEFLVANKIFEDAKRSIDVAIAGGRSSVSAAFYTDEGDLMSMSLGIRPASEYLTNSEGFLKLSKIFGSYNYNRPDVQAIQRQLDDVQSQLNLSDIESMAAKQIKELGAKRVEVYLQFHKTYKAKISSQGLFGVKTREESRPLDRYKLYYDISW